MVSFVVSFHLIEYVFWLSPTNVCAPVVVNVASSLFTKPLIEPSAVKAVPSYTFSSLGVVTFKGAFAISRLPSVTSNLTFAKFLLRFSKGKFI